MWKKLKVLKDDQLKKLFILIFKSVFNSFFNLFKNPEQHAIIFKNENSTLHPFKIKIIHNFIGS